MLKTIRGIAGTVVFSVFTAGAASAETLTISSWGGFFEETLAAEIYPGFTEKTGIEVKSIAQPEDSA